MYVFPLNVYLSHLACANARGLENHRIRGNHSGTQGMCVLCNCASRFHWTIEQRNYVMSAIFLLSSSELASTVNWLAENENKWSHISCDAQQWWPKITFCTGTTNYYSLRHSAMPTPASGRGLGQIPHSYFPFFPICVGLAVVRHN